MEPRLSQDREPTSKSAINIDKHRSSVQFQDSAIVHSYDSRRISTAPSLFSELVELRRPSATSSETDQHPQSNQVMISHSRAFSVLSEQSSEFSSMNKEFIDEAYHKYDSFTPFKTPLQSKHFFNNEQRINMPESVLRPVLSRLSNRRILQQSTQNLGEFLPVMEEGNVQKRNSFIQRSLSPSRSMLIRQQKQPAANLVPAEIKISKVQLLPARDKSPFLMKKLQEQRLNSTHSLECPLHPLVNKHLEQCRSENQHVPPPSPALSKDSESLVPSKNSSKLTADESNESCAITKTTNNTQSSIYDYNTTTSTLSHRDFLAENAESLQTGAKEGSAVTLDCYNKPILPTEEQFREDCEGNSEQILFCNDADDGGNTMIDEHQFVNDDTTSRSKTKDFDCIETTTNGNRPIGSLEVGHVIEFEPIITGEELDNSSIGTLQTESVCVDKLVRRDGGDYDDEEGQVSTSAKSFLILDALSENEDTSTNSPTTINSNFNLAVHVVDNIDVKPSRDSLRSVTSPIQAEDLTGGLSLNLELHDDILKAINNLDDFILSADESEDDDEEEFDNGTEGV